MENISLPPWDNYSSAKRTSIEQDQVERPPLTGKNRFVPSGLYDENWSRVGDAYGPATLTPFYIEALTSDDQNDVLFGSYGLYAATTHQGSVYPASKRAIPYLVDLLRLDKGAADRACHFLARIALGEQHFIKTPADYGTTKYFGAVKKHAAEVKAYYQRTHSKEALRLLCFIPGSLDTVPSFDLEDTCSDAEGNKHAAYLEQASALLSAGFYASEKNCPNKGFPSQLSDIPAGELNVQEHLVQAKELMSQSPSLLVRGCAALCLVFSGVRDAAAVQLLQYLGLQNYDGVDWEWESDLSELAKYAWFFASDTDTLIENNPFATLDYTSTNPDGTLQPNYSESEALFFAVERIMPKRYNKKNKRQPSLLPDMLDDTQKKLLRHIADTSPTMLYGYISQIYNIPRSVTGVKRVLREGSEELMREHEGVPLWYLIENAVSEESAISQSERRHLIETISQYNAWKMLSELYQTWGVSQGHERCTLAVAGSDDKEEQLKLASLMSDALQTCTQEIELFLDEWLQITAQYKAGDWGSKAPAQRIGISLLALARGGHWNPSYEPLVRPFHRTAQYAAFPHPLFLELLGYTSQEHQEKISEAFALRKAK